MRGLRRCAIGLCGLSVVVFACRDLPSGPAARHALDLSRAIPAGGPPGPAGPMAGPLSNAGPVAGPLSAPPLARVPEFAGPVPAPAMASATAPAGGTASGPDLVWHHPASGQGSIWHGTSYHDGFTPLQSVPHGWEIAGAADFTGNGSADLLWQNFLTGDRSIWHMEGRSWTGEFTVLPRVVVAWRVVAVSDFTANGSPDLVWQNVDTGQLSIWHMDGPNWSGQFTLLPAVPVGWRIAGAADLTGNGSPDLVWQNLETGQRSIWHMSGPEWNGAHTMLPQVVETWQIAAIADFNGDGHPDLVWQNLVTGQRSIWYMDGGTFTGQYLLLATVEVGWRIAGVRGSPDVQRTRVVAQIGPAGGELISRDGRLTLSVPEGALSAVTEISIKQIDAAVLGPDFDGLPDDIGDVIAYELGPAGIQFAQPVTIHITSEQGGELDDETVQIPLSLLLSADGGTPYILDKLRAEPDLENGTVTVSGEMAHFSRLVDVAIRFRGEKVLFGVTNVPDALHVGGTFSALASVEFPAAGPVVVGPPVTYSDRSTSPIVPTFQPPTGDLEQTHPFLYVGTFEYTCVEEGRGRYGARITAPVSFTLRDGTVISGETWSDLYKYVDCEEAPPPVTVVISPRSLAMEIGGWERLTATVSNAANQNVNWTSSDLSVATVNSIGWVRCGGPGTATITATSQQTPNAWDSVPVTCTLRWWEVDVRLEGPGTGKVDITTDVGTDPVECVKETEEPVECKKEFQAEPDAEPEVSFRVTPGPGVRIGEVVGADATSEPGVFKTRLDGENRRASLALELLVNPVTRFAVLQRLLLIEALSHIIPGWQVQPPEGGGAAGAMAPDGAGADPDCPVLMVAHGEGAAAVNTCTDEVIRVFPGPRSFDVLPVPTDGGPEYMLFSGPESIVCPVYEGGMCMFLPAARDVTYMGGVPAWRFVLVGLSVNLVRGGTVATLSSGLLPGHRESAVSDVAGAKLLVIGVTNGVGVLHYLDLSTDPPADPWISPLTGTNPRRIRCDFDSGVCASTDFAGSRLNVIMWDGESEPVLGGVTAAGALAAGPVGLDVFGRRIVTAGFNDNRYSITEVDENGAILGVTTAPLPEGCSQPGHAMFLRDGSNSIAVTCWGSNGYAVIVNAF
jgi:hypothetical protein